MAKKFSKTYTLTVEYSYDTGEDILETDMNVAVLRGKIKKAIGECLPVGMGVINAQLSGTVSET